MRREKGRVGSIWRRAITFFIVVIATVCFFSPTACYLSRGAWEEAKILGSRRPISDILTDKSVDSITRSKLAIVTAARRFARDSLGLKTGESYTAYSRLDRDTLVLVLSAARRDTLAPYTWWFPIVGRVPYKGYFDFGRAQKDAAGLEQDGFDTYLRPSDAFSTLGFFNDPLLSTTLRADTFDLANTVIHEVTHNTFYAPGQVPFNESFANFVGARGAAALFRSRGEEQGALEVEARWRDEQRLGAFWTSVKHSLDSAYASVASHDSMTRVRARDSVYVRARQRLRDSVSREFTTIPPQYAERVRLDNAALLARLAYTTKLELFDQVWEREGRDLKRSIARVVRLARAQPKDPFGAVQAWIASREGR
jgi:predicted aminopeptidase